MTEDAAATNRGGSKMGRIQSRKAQAGMRVYCCLICKETCAGGGQPGKCPSCGAMSLYLKEIDRCRGSKR